MKMRLAAAVMSATLGIAPASLAQNVDAAKPVSDRQVAVMMFVDYGRSYGYQSMVAAIQIDVVKAQIARDQALLTQKEELYRKKVIPFIELDIARLKNLWNRKQLVVAEKSLATVSAQYEAMADMARHFGGVDVPANALYATFRRAWDAGCEKGPDELEAMQAWAQFASRSAERARQLNRLGRETASSLLEKQMQWHVARANYEHRASRLDRCRAVLFPALEEILAVGR
jgi:hypothetical protein